MAIHVRHARPAAWVVLAAFCALAAPAYAQQAVAYSNPLDDPSDVANWYLSGEPYIFAVDSSPVAGHSGASLNWNNGTDIDGAYPYGYCYVDGVDVTGMTTPTLSFWCRYEMNPDPFFDYREIYMYPYDSPDYIWLMFMGDRDGDGNIDLDCGAMNQWHQHMIALPDSFADAGSFYLQFYTYSSGYYEGAGLDGWFIDDLQILVADTTPPYAVLDLAANNPTQSSADLSWSSPHDDDVSGVAASFDLRYSTSPITNVNFHSATLVSGEPAPGVEGEPHLMTVTGLIGGTTYYFAIRTTDIAGNVSGISNVVTVTTLAAANPAPAAPSSGPKVVDPILPCSAGVAASPIGLLVLAGMAGLAGAARMAVVIARRSRVPSK